MIQIMRIILVIMAIVCLGGCDKKNKSIYHNIIFKENKANMIDIEFSDIYL